MALATRCPACSTVFRISTAQAAAKGGMVRCGQCRNVFNSLDALVRVEDLEVIDEVVANVPESAEEALPESIFVAPSPDPIVEHHDDEPVLPPVEIEQQPVISEWWLPDPAASRIEAPEPAAETTSESRADAGRLISGKRTDLQWPGTSLDGTNPSFMRPDEHAPPARRAVRWVLGLLTLLALTGLLGQTAYLLRDELAARWSPARPWLLAACGVLRCKVDYPMHLDSVTIESASIRPTGSNVNVYELAALLRNRDTIDVRYPQLELVLTDVQDRPILRRALRPEDYLPPGRDVGRSPQAGFAAQSELPIRIMFELSDLRFAGFRLERFYP